jgi:hypothetical protein
MKRLLFAAFCFLISSGVSLAQSVETFDILTYKLPAGWQKQSDQNSLQIATEDQTDRTFCLITVVKSIPSLDTPQKSFEAAWQTVVKESVTVTGAPQMIPAENKGDWQALSGYAPFEKNGEKGVAVLLNISGHGSMVNVLILTNTQKYETKITAFLESISLKTPERNVGQQNVGQQSEGGTPTTDIVGVWGMSSSGQSNFEAKHGLSGYISRQYTFSSNGTYEFLIKTFSYTSDKLLFTKETGTYQLSGNSLTIIPQKSVIQTWSRRDGTDKWGQLLSSQNRPLEKVSYQVTKHYFSGIQEWNLVLKASQPTERDGPFTTVSDFPNSWLYKPQRFPVQPPQ